MMTISLAAYAKTHGVSKQAATAWKARGALVMRGDQVDVEASDERMKAAGKGRFRVKAHGGRRTAGVRGEIDRPGLGYVAGSPSQAANAPPLIDPAEYPDLAAQAGRSPPALAYMIAESVLGASDEDPLSLLDSLAWSGDEEDRQHGEWYRWPDRIAAGLAATLRIPKRADELRDALRALIVDRLENELLIDAEIYASESVTSSEGK